MEVSEFGSSHVLYCTVTNTQSALIWFNFITDLFSLMTAVDLPMGEEQMEGYDHVGFEGGALNSLYRRVWNNLEFEFSSRYSLKITHKGLRLSVGIAGQRLGTDIRTVEQVVAGPPYQDMDCTLTSFLVSFTFLVFAFPSSTHTQYTYIQYRIHLTDRTGWRYTYENASTPDFKWLETEVCSKIREAISANYAVINAYLGCNCGQFHFRKNVYGTARLKFYTERYLSSGITPFFLATFLNNHMDRNFFAGFCESPLFISLMTLSTSKELQAEVCATLEDALENYSILERAFTSCEVRKVHEICNAVDVDLGFEEISYLIQDWEDHELARYLYQFVDRTVVRGISSGTVPTTSLFVVVITLLATLLQ
ncbi:unnamed protein product [Calicophoron daubneyi]|uniref:Uncharacterized protein n=1 Tax=Calicophoron daubneyi TaxID=300641 RepID=A0AAV2TEV9_CALDB